jgi:ribosomal protein S18 acetylase RimI-like enzyme
MKLRRATADDALVVATLGAVIQASHQPERPDWFKPANPASALELYREMLSDSKVTVFLAEEGDDALGFLMAVTHERPDTPLSFAQTVLEIDQIGVAPSARRRGVGHALFQAALELAEEVSARRVVLTTWVFNDGAHRFFESEGFAIELHRMSMAWPPTGMT